MQELSYNNDNLEEEVAKEEVVVNRPPVRTSAESQKRPLPSAARIESAGHKKLGEES